MFAPTAVGTNGFSYVRNGRMDHDQQRRVFFFLFVTASVQLMEGKD